MVALLWLSPAALLPRPVPHFLRLLRTPSPLTFDQQAEAAAAYFPDLGPILREAHFAARRQRGPATAPPPTPPPLVVHRAPVDNGVDDATFRNLLARYNQQEAALTQARADHDAAMHDQ
jgi:hypothetical protein